MFRRMYSTSRLWNRGYKIYSGRTAPLHRINRRPSPLYRLRRVSKESTFTSASYAIVYASYLRHRHSSAFGRCAYQSSLCRLDQSSSYLARNGIASVGTSLFLERSCCFHVWPLGKTMIVLHCHVSSIRSISGVCSHFLIYDF